MTEPSGSRRLLTGLVALFWAATAFALYRRADWATWIWPWNDGRLTYVFLASIAAAVAAPLFWIALTDDPAALAGIAIDGFAIGIALSIAFLAMGIARNESRLFLYGLGTAIGAIGSGYVFTRSHGLLSRSNFPLPRYVRFSFIAFVVVLISAGIGLVTGRNGFFPWTIPSATSTIIGSMFLGAAAYFSYGIWQNTWTHGAGPLFGFLAYDVVLFWPYLDNFLNRNEQTSLGMYGTTVAKVDGLNLALYLAVLIVSAAIAVFYLAINRSTRVWPSVK